MNRDTTFDEHINTIKDILQNNIYLKKIFNDYEKCALVLEENELILYIDNNRIDNIFEIINKAKSVPSNIPAETTDIQMLRIKDGRITATKMILMHLVTGQIFKHNMVEETIKLTDKLYKSTNIDFVNTTDTTDTFTIRGGNRVDYNEKYLKYKKKYLKLKNTI